MYIARCTCKDNNYCAHFTTSRNTNALATTYCCTRVYIHIRCVHAHLIRVKGIKHSALNM